MALILAVTRADGVVQTTVAKKLGIKTVANKKRVANIAREILFRYKNSSK